MDIILDRKSGKKDEGVGYNLDKYQKQAVESCDKNTLVVAAPGSGKTTVIINKVDYLVSHRRIPNGNIVVITFTKAAAQNMKKRYEDNFKRERSPFFGTFHGLFYKMLLKSGLEIEIVDGSIVHKIVSNTLSKYFDEVGEDKVKEVINNISVFKTSRSEIADFKPSVSKEVFAEAFNAYEDYKKENNKYDFDDLAIKTLDMLNNNENILNGYRRLFKYILVDEFQDCDELQIEFLRLINEGEDNNLFAVGDEDQCIYSFRGSRPEYMVSFDNIFQGGKKYYLAINYRSKKNIVERSKKVIAFNKERNDKDIKYNRDEEGEIKWFNSFNEKVQAEMLADIIKENKSLGTSYEDNAVLYRTNIESMIMIDIFTKRNMPFRLLDREYNFFEHFICRDILAYLRLAVNQYDKESFIQIINKPFRYVSKSNLSYIRTYKAEENPFDILINKEDIPPFQKRKMDDLKNDINYLNKISLSSAIAYIVMDLGYIDHLRTYAEKFSQSIEDLEDIIEEFKVAAEGYKTIFEFLTHVKEVEESIEESKKNTNREGIILSTIHGVKGMEFKNVFIINVCEETIPYSSSIKDNLEEERRVFYVGITRAIDNLYIFSPKNRRGQFKETSRFVVEGGFNNLPMQSYGYKEGDVIRHRIHGDGIIKELENNRIKIEFNDNTYRSFDFRVLMENKLIEKK